MSSRSSQDPRADARRDAVPVLLRPFYLASDGTLGESADESTVVSSTRWLSEQWNELPEDWGMPLLRALATTNRGAWIGPLAGTSLAAYQQPAGDSQPSDGAPAGETAEAAPLEGGGTVAEGTSRPSTGKGLGGEEKLGTAPEDNTLQFLRFETVLLEPGQHQFDVGLVYTINESDFPAFLAPDAVADARFRQRQLLVPLELRYGLARRLQMFVNLPFGWGNTELAMPGFDEFDNDGGVGDLRAGLTMQLAQPEDDGPVVTATFAVTAPTGDATFFPGFSALAPASLGEGFWALSGEILFIHSYDPIVVFWGLNTRHRFETEFVGVDVLPGGEYGYRLGVGFAVNERITLSTSLQGAYIPEVRIEGERVPGTIQEPISLRFAATIARKKRLIEPFADIGMTSDAAAARLGIVWTF